MGTIAKKVWKRTMSIMDGGLAGADHHANVVEVCKQHGEMLEALQNTLMLAKVATCHCSGNFRCTRCLVIEEANAAIAKGSGE